MPPNVANYVGVYAWDHCGWLTDKPFMALVPPGNGEYDPKNVSESVAPVPKLVYKLARTYLDKWETTFRTECAVKETEAQLSEKIHTDHREFDAMGGGVPRTSSLPYRPYVRRVSSISGRDTFSSYYMEDVVGEPPDKSAYPVTNQREPENAGWVKWKFL